jgi:hypothetical protein
VPLQLTRLGGRQTSAINCLLISGIPLDAHQVRVVAEGVVVPSGAGNVDSAGGRA